MNEVAIAQYIADTFEGLDVAVASGDTFIFYDVDRKLPPNRKLPFATIVTRDAYDRASNLDRPGVFRLNIGVGKETYRSLFGPPPAPSETGEVLETGHDYTALDKLIPHPVYASMSWVCVLNPSDATFQTVIQPLLAEAYEIAVRRYAKFMANE